MSVRIRARRPSLASARAALSSWSIVSFRPAASTEQASAGPRTMTTYGCGVPPGSSRAMIDARIEAIAKRCMGASRYASLSLSCRRPQPTVIPSPSPSGEGLGWGCVSQRPTGVLESLHPQPLLQGRRGLVSCHPSTASRACFAIAVSCASASSNRPSRSASRRNFTRSTSTSLGVGCCPNSAITSSAKSSSGW